MAEDKTKTKYSTTVAITESIDALVSIIMMLFNTSFLGGKKEEFQIE